MTKYKSKKFEFGEFRLQDLINMKSLTTEQKAQFIEDIFNSKIQFVYPKDNCLPHFIFNEKEVLNWISKLE